MPVARAIVSRWLNLKNEKMKHNSVVVKTSPDGSFSFWSGGFNFSSEYPDARLVTCSNAREIAKLIIVKFPDCGIEVVRNYGMKNETGVMI